VKAVPVLAGTGRLAKLLRALTAVRGRTRRGAAAHQRQADDNRHPIDEHDDPRYLYYVGGNPVLSVPVDRMRYTDGRRYTADEHHFVRYYHEGVDALQHFYRVHRPRDILQAFFLDSGRDGLPPPTLVPWLGEEPEPPPLVGECGLGMEHGVQQFGPVSPEKIRLEARRLDTVLESIKRDGFQPSLHGYPQGYFLYRSDGDWRFVVRGGLHRVAALSHLGYPRIEAQFFPHYPRFVSEADLEAWPLVRSGAILEAEARAIFDQFFRDDSVIW
jgi:hypothetical protein